jgi:putative flavoprotein involved in K+ transport
MNTLVATVMLFESAEWFSTYLSKYAKKYHLPVREHAAVISVEKEIERNLFLLEVKEKETIDRWSCNQVVIASGIMNTSKIPVIGESLPSSIVQLHSSTYKNPEQLPKGASSGGGKRAIRLSNR